MWQKNVVLKDKTRKFFANITDTEPSEQRSTYESSLHSVWRCWNISGSDQREKSVLFSDNTLTNAPDTQHGFSLDTM